jgi:uncharacterized phage protein gp47/JayE
MSSPTSAIISLQGISAPAFASILSFYTAQWQSIYGSDVYLAADTQDAQFLGILSQATADANSAAIAAYNSFSPATGTGAALSQNVQLNSLQRLVPSNSNVVVTLVGAVGTQILNGVLTDTVGGYRWDLPYAVVIGAGGTASATAVCETAGAINAAPGTVTQVAAGLVIGWQSVSNPAAATAGLPVESDGALRTRQATSTTLPTLGVMDGIIGALLTLPGVVAAQAYLNTTNSTNSNGITANSMCFVVEGGSASAITNVIAIKKTPGVGVYGTTSVSVNVAWSSSPLTISYVVAALVPIQVAISLHALTNYTTSIAAEIKNAVAAYVNSLSIGQTVSVTRIYAPASLFGPFAVTQTAVDTLTFELVSIQIALVGGTNGTADILPGFNGDPTCIAANVTITQV